MATTTIDPGDIDPQVMQYLHYNIPKLEQMLKDRIGKKLNHRSISKYRLAAAIHHYEKSRSFRRFMDLAPELRAVVYHHLFARPQFRCGGPICYPQIMATSSKIREEAYDIFHGGISNNYKIAILLTSEVITVQQSRPAIPANQLHPGLIAIPRRDETYTSAWITVGEDTASRRVCRRFKASEMDLMQMADSWPMFVRTAMHLQVTVRLSTQPGFLDFLTDKPFLAMNHLLYSLAHSAQACKKLELRILDLIHPNTRVPFTWTQILSGACMFDNVQTCKVIAWDKYSGIWEKPTGLSRHAYLNSLVVNPIASPTSGHDVLALHDRGRFILDVVQRGKLMSKVCAKWPDFRLLEFSLPLLRLYAKFEYLPHGGVSPGEIFGSTHPYWKIGMVVRDMREKNKKYKFRLEEVSKRVLWFSDGSLDRVPADQFGVTLSQALSSLRTPAQPVGEVVAHGAHGTQGAQRALGRAKRVFREIKAAAEHRTR